MWLYIQLRQKYSLVCGVGPALRLASVVAHVVELNWLVLLLKSLGQLLFLLLSLFLHRVQNCLHAVRGRVR